ncbi:MAG: CoA transferase [Thaumarchaeota archaeon]|nr:CoA transferase [Nitrososphaerota archaeon]
MMDGALHGLRALETGVQIAGPYCGRLLAELGAEVIKIEPPSGEPSRRSPPLSKGVSISYLYWNANKKNLALNLKEDLGKRVYLDLAKKSDIIVSNFRPGVMDKLGLGYEDMRKVNPRIIYVSITGFGSFGPLSNQAGYDMLAQAMSGLADANTCPDGSPKINSMSLDYSAAMMGAISVLAALFHREKSGVGQFIDISLQDVGLIYAQHLMGQDLFGYNYRSGNRRLAFAPFSVYKTRNGNVVVAIDEDSKWKAFLKVVGKPELSEDPRFESVEARVKNYDAIDAILSEWTQTRETEDVVDVITSLGGASCAVMTIPEVFKDEEGHLKSRGIIGKIPSGLGEEIPFVGSALKLSKTPGKVETLGPRLGEHTEYILQNIAGYDRERIASLRASKVIA